MQPEEKVSVVVLFPFLLEAEDDAYHRWSPLTMSRTYSEGSQRNTFLYSRLLREIIIKDIAEYETNKKIIPNKQGLKTNVDSLKVMKKEMKLPPILTMMGKSHFVFFFFLKKGNNLYSS